MPHIADVWLACLLHVTAVHIPPSDGNIYSHTACAFKYTGCFTTLGHNCRRRFPRSL